MATPDFTAGSVMDAASSLLNDTAKQTYTYAVQLPYLNMALQDLRKLLELNNSPVTDQVSAILIVPTSITTIGFATSPALPSDLVDIQELWESPTGTNQWIPMSKKNFFHAK